MSFSADVVAIAAQMRLDLNATRRGVLLSLFREVITRTPVLTGRLRGEWQCSARSPLLGEVGMRGEGVPEGQVPPELEAEILRVLSELKGDVPVYLTNNLPYGPPIEFEGHSKVKAPAGMVRVSVANAVANIEAKLRGVK